MNLFNLGKLGDEVNLLLLQRILLLHAITCRKTLRLFFIPRYTVLLMRTQRSRQSSASTRRLARFLLGTGYFVNKRAKGQLISPALSCFPRVSLPCIVVRVVTWFRCRLNTAIIHVTFVNFVSIRNSEFSYSNPICSLKSPLTFPLYEPANFKHCSENLLYLSGDNYEVCA